MDEDEQWQELVRSIRKATRILNYDIPGQDMPLYLDWPAGAKLHKDLWNEVYLRNAKRRRS